LEDKDLCTNLPPAELPATQDVCHIVVHAVDEEEVPSLESLAKDSHLAETTTGTTTREENSSRGLGLDEHLGAHLDTRPELACDVTKEPILGDTEARMFVECLDEKLTVPKRDSTVREGGRTNLTGEGTLDTTELVFEILCSGMLLEMIGASRRSDLLLAEVSLGRVRADGLDGVANAHHVSLKTVGNDREVLGQCTVVVDEKDVLEGLCCIATNKLSHNLRANGAPQVVDAVRLAHLFGVVQGCLAVSVGEDEDVLRREDLQSSLEGGGDESGGLVARNQKRGIFDVVLHDGVCVGIGGRRVLLEEDQERSEGVATIRLVFCVCACSRDNLQEGDTKGDTETSRENELVLDDPVQPPNSSPPQRHSNENEVDKAHQEEVDAPLKQNLGPLLSLHLDTSLFGLLVRRPYGVAPLKCGKRCICELS
jgi:hypothetical protein